MQRVLSFLLTIGCIGFGSFVAYGWFVAGYFTSELDRRITPLIMLVLFAVGLSNLWVVIQPRRRIARQVAAVVTALVVFLGAGALVYLDAGWVRPTLLVLLGGYILWYNFLRPSDVFEEN
jgi:hypothetical protein